MTPFRLTFDTEEAHEVVQVKECAAKAKAAKRQEQRLALQRFKPRDLVLRKIAWTTNNNKLTPYLGRPIQNN
ncbi:hypothetical protein CR513_59501, partial [Mucuna pruriens]